MRRAPLVCKRIGKTATHAMEDGPLTTARSQRADAVRNRERALEAAEAVFSAGGSDASLEAVVRRARV